MISINGEIQKSHRRHLTRKNFLLNGLGLTKYLRESNRIVYNNLFNYKEIDQPIGAFLLFNKKHFLSVGGFDNDFFVYYEDVFLFNELNKKFNKMKYYENVSILHKGGESTKNSVFDMLKLQIMGKKIYFKKMKWKKMPKYYLILEFALKVLYYFPNLKLYKIKELFKYYIK